MLGLVLNAFLLLFTVKIILADQDGCIAKMQEYGQVTYCAYYGSLCPTACGQQPTSPLPVYGAEPPQCASLEAQFGKDMYCQLYGSVCPISCGQQQSSVRPTTPLLTTTTTQTSSGPRHCPEDYSGCGQIM